MFLIRLDGAVLRLSFNKIPVNIGVGVIPAPIYMCKKSVEIGEYLDHVLAGSLNNHNSCVVVFSHMCLQFCSLNNYYALIVSRNLFEKNFQ